MTSQQEKDIRDQTYVIGRFISEMQDKSVRATYWCVKASGTTLTIDGHAAFSSYGEAKHFARLGLKRILYDIQNLKPHKDDKYTKDCIKYLSYINALEGDEYERAVIELRDLLIETGVLTIREEDY